MKTRARESDDRTRVAKDRPPAAAIGSLGVPVAGRMASALRLGETITAGGGAGLLLISAGRADHDRHRWGGRRGAVIDATAPPAVPLQGILGEANLFDRDALYPA